MTMQTPPDGTPDHPPRVVTVSADAIERDVAHLTNLVRWLIALLIVNLVATLYVVEFVRHIEQLVHSL